MQVFVGNDIATHELVQICFDVADQGFFDLEMFPLDAGHFSVKRDEATCSLAGVPLDRSHEQISGKLSNISGLRAHLRFHLPPPR